MYNPSRFAISDLKLAHQLIAENPLALLIGPDAEQKSFVTHVPLTVIKEEEGWLLEGHMARANPHWAWLSQQSEALAVFGGPSGYVSPRHYDDLKQVPTWNYLAVHAYGSLSLIDDPLGKDRLLKRLIAQHEPGYAQQWMELPEDFQQRMLGAIVGFRLHVTRWEAKFKLSQNRSAAERTRIRQAFAEGSAQEQAMAAWMQHLGL
nr:FMN-binding negative transcriptional regulator [uncultured Roseateles sp.]